MEAKGTQKAFILTVIWCFCDPYTHLNIDSPTTSYVIKCGKLALLRQNIVKGEMYNHQTSWSKHRQII